SVRPACAILVRLRSSTALPKPCRVCCATPIRNSMPDEPITEPTPEASGGEAMVSTDPVADLQRERDDYYDRWMRKAAEFDNYRKRVERERREQRDQAVGDRLLRPAMVKVATA